MVGNCGGFIGVIRELHIADDDAVAAILCGGIYHAVGGIRHRRGIRAYLLIPYHVGSLAGISVQLECQFTACQDFGCHAGYAVDGRASLRTGHAREVGVAADDCTVPSVVVAAIAGDAAEAVAVARKCIAQCIAGFHRAAAHSSNQTAANATACQDAGVPH